MRDCENGHEKTTSTCNNRVTIMDIFYCDECGQQYTIDNCGIAKHMHGDIDNDHVPYGEERVKNNGIKNEAKNIIIKAMTEAGATMDDCMENGMQLTDALKMCAEQTNMGTDGDYSKEDRQLFYEAARKIEDEEKAYHWARQQQGFTGTLTEWLEMTDKDRQEYEQGAAGIPTA